MIYFTKLFYLVIILVFSSSVYADARPVTYNIEIDFNSVTGRFENPRASGPSGVTINIQNAAFPIELSMAKDGVTGLAASDAGGGNQQLALRRTYSNFSFNLINENKPQFLVPIKAFIHRSSIMFDNVYSHFSTAFNNGLCTEVTARYDGSPLVIANTNPGCVAKTYDTGTGPSPLTGFSEQRYYFDTDRVIASTLSSTSFPVGKYRGSVTYNGDSVFSRVYGRMTERYTFNFVINKLKQLNVLNFTDGNSISFNVNESGSHYIGYATSRFNVEGVFSVGSQLRLTLNSLSSVNNKLSMKNSNSPNASIDYKVDIVDSKFGQTNIFSEQGQSKIITLLERDKFSGVMNFDFVASKSITPDGNYTDVLTVLVEIIP